MKRRPSGYLTIKQAVEGFFHHKIAEGLSPNTLINYRHDLKLWGKFQGNSLINMITTKDFTGYMAWLRTEYEPERFNGNTKPLSNKSLRNHWICLSSVFTWYCREFTIENPMQNVLAPKFGPVKFTHSHQTACNAAHSVLRRHRLA